MLNKAAGLETMCDIKVGDFMDLDKAGRRRMKRVEPCLESAC